MVQDEESEPIVVEADVKKLIVQEKVGDKTIMLTEKQIKKIKEQHETTFYLLGENAALQIYPIMKKNGYRHDKEFIDDVDNIMELIEEGLTALTSMNLYEVSTCGYNIRIEYDTEDDEILIDITHDVTSTTIKV
jgi:hypothetical protein